MMGRRKRKFGTVAVIMVMVRTAFRLEYGMNPELIVLATLGLVIDTEAERFVC